MLKDFRFYITSLLAVFLAVNFWTGSRYPSLNEKASMGTTMNLQAVGFDVLWEVTPSDSTGLRISKNIVNWLETNKKGMTFGLLFAACLMTLLETVPMRKDFGGGFKDAALGLGLGAPLGVCVNCAAPIGRGLYAGGASPATAIAAMLSSPALNVVVVGMVFTLFPLYFVVLKVACTLFLVLVGVPLLVRVLGVKDQRCEVPEKVGNVAGGMFGGDSQALGRSFFRSLGWVVVTFVKKLWKICYLTVPTMILAGALGAFLATIMPWGMLVDKLSVVSPLWTLFAMVGIALFATFLPIPIAFDVLLAATLHMAGLPTHFTLVLLCTLGAYSIYSYFVVSEALTIRLATGLFLLVASLGVVAGALGHFYEGGEEARQAAYIEAQLQSVPEHLSLKAFERESSETTHWSDLRPQLEAARQIPEAAFTVASSAGNVFHIDRYPFRPSADRAPGTFRLQTGPEVGLEVPFGFDPAKVVRFPLLSVRSMAVADVHRDGWPDVLVTADSEFGGPLLYANQGGEGFVRQAVNLGAVEAASEMAVFTALVDLDGDGWVDILFGTYDQGIHWVRNHEGSFEVEAPRLIDGAQASFAGAAAIADFDGNGWLDLAVGRYTIGRGSLGPIYESSRDSVFYQEAPGVFREVPLAGIPGDTLAMLATDLNADGHPDLIVGNDFQLPDYVYLGQPDGTLQLPDQRGLGIPYTTQNTMSYNFEDLDNDLQPELFSAQIARDSGSWRSKYSIEAEEHGAQFADQAEAERFENWSPRIKRLIRSGEKRFWEAIEDPRDRLASIGNQVLLEATSGDPAAKARMGLSAAYFGDLNAKIAGPTYEPSEAEEANQLPQIFGRNVLLQKVGEEWVDIARDSGLAFTGFTWNTQFADFDLDGWLDLFLVNGYARTWSKDPNLLYRNLGGGRFEALPESAGLMDYAETSASAVFDYDGDGDLDIVTLPMLADARLFENAGAEGHGICFAFEDETRGNPFAIGARITISHGPDGIRKQTREIRLSGGYLSYQAPELWFGLGEDSSVGEVEIIWPDGSREVVSGPFEAGARYVFKRD